MPEPATRMHIDEQFWIRQLNFVRAGDQHAGHLHSHDHLTLIAHGSIRVTCEGVSQDFEAPHIVTITKMKVHDLVALTDGAVAYCVASIADVVRGK